MNNPTEQKADAPPRILIVENESGSVGNLKHKLERDVPYVVVESADSVDDGQKMLNADSDYDVVILDFRLPQHHGSRHEVGNVSLGFVRNPDTLVIHATAWPNDPLFKQMVDASKSGSAGPRMVFHKFGNWSQEVVDACVKHIREQHTRRIRAEFDRLFSNERRFGRRHQALSRPDGGPGEEAWNFAFVRFCRDAAQHWKELNPDLQDRLSRTVGHTVYEGRDIVGVVTQDDSVPDACPEEPL